MSYTSPIMVSTTALNASTGAVSCNFVWAANWVVMANAALAVNAAVATNVVAGKAVAVALVWALWIGAAVFKSALVLPVIRPISRE